VGPPGLGLGKAEVLGDSPGGVITGVVGELEARLVVPARPLQAQSAKTTDARTVALT